MSEAAPQIGSASVLGKTTRPFEAQLQLIGGITSWRYP